MKKIFTVVALFIAGSAFSQSDNVGIGTTAPDNSAILDLSSSNKGFLLPRMTEDQRSQILNPAEGLQVFQTDGKSGLYIFNNNNWTTSANSVSAAGDPWLRGGNNIVGGEFIGTTNNQPLVFKVANQLAGKITNSGPYQTFIGQNAGQSSSANHNTAFGYNALSSSTTSLYNTAIGSQALAGANTGAANTAIGYSALNANTEGIQNAAIGINALKKNTTGRDNMAIGTYSLQENLTGNSNTAMGTFSLSNLKVGSSNTGLGYYALGDAGKSEVGGGAPLANRNVAVGYYALRKLDNANDNVAIGNSALGSVVSGSKNVAIGTGAIGNNTGSGNIAIGYQAGLNETESDKLYISNSSSDTPLIYGDFAAKYVSIGDIPVGKRSAATAGYNLLVKGGILTEKVKVALASSGDWADYVFEEDYNLMPLASVEKFISENKHLPNVPSANEMALKGMDVAQTSKMFMEKIEELTLYIIELKKEVEALKVTE